MYSEYSQTLFLIWFSDTALRSYYTTIFYYLHFTFTLQFFSNDEEIEQKLAAFLFKKKKEFARARHFLVFFLIASWCIWIISKSIFLKFLLGIFAWSRGYGNYEHFTRFRSQHYLCLWDGSGTEFNKFELGRWISYSRLKSWITDLKSRILKDLNSDFSLISIW